MFEDSALLPVLLAGTRTHAGVILTAVALTAALVFFRWSMVAFQMRVAGLAPRAATYAGFSHQRMVWIGLLTGVRLPVWPVPARLPGRSGNC
ncbi:MAG: hypothetical protein R3E89_15340 [Thiolinea sp.]